MYFITDKIQHRKYKVYQDISMQINTNISLLEVREDIQKRNR